MKTYRNNLTIRCSPRILAGCQRLQSIYGFVNASSYKVQCIMETINPLIRILIKKKNRALQGATVKSGNQFKQRQHAQRSAESGRNSLKVLLICNFSHDDRIPSASIELNFSSLQHINASNFFCQSFRDFFGRQRRLA
jgi:hypothetical protein